MADIGKITINGKLIYPTTVSEAIYVNHTESDLKGPLNEVLAKQQTQISNQNDQINNKASEILEESKRYTDEGLQWIDDEF